MSPFEMSRKHAAILLAALLCAFHFSSFDVTTQPVVTDVRFFLYFAAQVAAGAVPHLDYFDNKTQLATFTGALLHGLGEPLGADPLTAVRVGYLGLAALAGMASFFIFRRLGKGSVAGGLGLAAHCSFGLLGVLPSIGNIPKLLMALAASFAALLAWRRSWFLAGVAAAVSFMDWQIGALAGVAALAAAAAYGAPRWRAVGLVAGGGVAGLAPFTLYYFAHGALGETVRQVVGASLFRGSTAMAHGGLPRRLDRIAEVAGLACPSQQWLFYLGLAGAVVVAVWLWRWRRDERARLLLPLAVYHFGVIGFTLVDFQYYGDFFLLLHSVAFLLGALWVALHDLLARALTAPRAGRVATGAALALALLAARPGFLRPTIRLVTRRADPAVTLADQRQVAERLSAHIGDRTLAFLDHSEMLVLMRRPNTLPLVYWNIPAWSHYRQSKDEPFADVGARMLLSTGAGAVAAPRVLGYDSLLLSGYSVTRFESDNGRYAVTVAIRTAQTTRGAGPSR